MSVTSLYNSKDFLLVSLPQNVEPANGSNATSFFENDLYNGICYTANFQLPIFKIGSLDELVTESEELSKIDNATEQIVGKIIELAHSTEGPNTHKSLSIEHQSLPEFLTNFKWDAKKFKLDKPIQQLINDINSDTVQLDTYLKATAQSYSTAKQQLQQTERKKNGDLSVKSLYNIVGKDDFITDSEYLTTALIVVPLSLRKQFLNHYETLSENVVPRSATSLAEDSEYVLFNVHLFKKSLHKFQQACRENKYIPREFTYSEDLVESSKKEFEDSVRVEQQLKQSLTRLIKYSYSDCFINWIHIKCLRVFVESVLRYGLPPVFNSKIIAVPSKFKSKCRNDLIENFGYLGGNAFAKDFKTGKIKTNDTSLHEYASLVDTEYEPFVLYSIEI
ncbi:V-type proton ATPase subunit C [Hanseniaspora uvarum DSM 2768]|nr:V-type proton ATPase subunit C [Hanseniaspora uvarum DSM 2768]